VEWILYGQIVFGDMHISVELKTQASTKEKMKKKCRGIPLISHLTMINLYIDLNIRCATAKCEQFKEKKIVGHISFFR